MAVSTSVSVTLALAAAAPVYDSRSIVLAVPDATGVAGGSSVPSWLELCGREIANAARTAAYYDAGLGGERVTLEVGALCPALSRVDGAPVTFASPAADPAPWYDPDEPESALFLGFVPLDTRFVGASTRATALRGTGRGTILGARSSPGVQVKVSGVLLAANVAGMRYGWEWLSHVVRASLCDPCGSCDLAVRTSCPPGDGSNDRVGLRYAYGCDVIDGPNPADTLDAYCGEMLEVEMTFQSSSPYLYEPASVLLPPRILNPEPADAPLIDFDVWLCGPYGPVQSAPILPPLTGSTAAVVRIESGADGVGALRIATYAACPPDVVVDVASREIRTMPLAPNETLIVDAARRIARHFDASGVESNGVAYIAPMPGRPIEWPEVFDCDGALCVAVGAVAPCSGGRTTTVSIDAQRSEQP